MTCLKVDLRVLNVDLDDEWTFEVIGARLSDLIWSSVDGRVKATLIASEASMRSSDRVAMITHTSRRIVSALPDAVIECLDEDLVSTSDIAARLNLSRETVRMYTTGARGPGCFPLPIATLGSGNRGGVKVWRWDQVNAWLSQLGLQDDYEYLTRAEVTEANSALLTPKHQWIGVPLAPAADARLGSKAVSLDAYRIDRDGRPRLFAVQ